jgi:5-methylcytosine-specific restriction endonuclease McrBC regulatory subunit McrC
MIALPNTQSTLSGQVSNFIELIESQISDPIQLSDIQLLEIKKIGQELASKKSFYGVDEDDELDADGKNTAEVIKCVSTNEGLHRVRVHNAIGSIALTDLTIHVLPKISMNHFVHLASRTFEDPRSHKNPVNVSSLDAFRNVLAIWCVESIEKLTRSGLISEYREFEEKLPLVRGRVNSSATAAQFLRGRLQVECRFEELDIDNPLNRIIKAALNLIAMERNEFSSDLRSRSNDIYQRMPRVGRIKNSDLRVQLGRHSNHYSGALDLSLRIIAGSAIDIRSGTVSGQTFLIPTPGLIEMAILKILESNLAPIQVKKSGKVVSQNVYFSINPDLVFNNGSVTGDVKYKIASTNWVRTDVAQAAMFASGFNAKAAVIVTFSNSPGNTDLEMNLGELPLHRITWNAAQVKDPIEAEEEFLARMRTFLLPFQHVT